MLQAALAWADRGFPVFPLRVGAKRPVAKGWTETATTDPGEIAAIWQDQNYNIGVLTDNLVVVDVDVKNGKQGMASFMALDLPMDTLTVRTPTGGLHVYYRGPNVSLSVGALGDGLDIRSFHGYVLAPGSWLDPDLPENKGVGGHYTLANEGCAQEAVPELLDRLAAPKERTGQPAIELPDHASALGRARDYLAQTAPVAVEGVGGDHTTYRVACVLKDYGVGESDAFDLMLDWNERCVPPWDTDELRTKVENAYAYGTSQPGTLHPAVEFADVAIPRPVARGARPWLHHGDPWNTNASWLYHQFLPTTGVALLTAPSAAGKTFTVLALAHSLATGDAFFETPEVRGGTLILAAEGATSFGRRMAALGMGQGRLPIAMTSVGALAANGALAALQIDLKAKAAEMLEEYGVPVRLIVLDTLSASGLLLDENSNTDAANAIKALDTISRDMNALVLTTHHPPKNKTGERGAGAIRNNSDYVLEITREGAASIRDIELTKARDCEQRMLGSFVLNPVTLGQDEKGRDIVSCTLSIGGPKMAREKRPPSGLEDFMVAIDLALNEGAEPKAEIEVAQGYFKDVSSIRDRSNRRAMFVKCLAWAENAGSLIVNMGGDGVKILERKEFLL
jgi:hypothetical protein